MEVAAFLPTHALIINETVQDAGEFVEFDRVAGTITIRNENKDGADLLLFGGEPYTEPIVAHGPFVMNTDQEIAQAYKDYHTGKYGEIDFDKA
jgi:redox-sensitive bicupin YhaK (pirin superfamily)